ncbi:MAG: TrmB family transcriptional regulator [Halobaculum sp.]
MTVDEDRLAGLRDLGLSEYEAAVFAGLVSLGTGSASEVAEVTDVPRSQVYGAADALEERGLIDVQEGTPTVYRPVPVEQARESLYDRLERRTDPAFDYLEELVESRPTEEGGREAVWRTDRPENVADRAATLIDEAEESVVYGAGDPARVEGAVAEALARAADRGVRVTLISADDEVLRAADDTAVTTRAVADRAAPDVSNGRVLVADGRAVLLSVLPTEAVPTVTHETAFWSADTAFAGVLATLIRQWMDQHLAADG